MRRLALTAVLTIPLVATAQGECPKGYQPYANRCVTQRMADYISCVEASGGNKQEISEELKQVNGDKTAGSLTGSGKAPVVQGSGALTLDKKSESEVVKKLEKKWFPSGMSECAKPLNSNKKSTIEADPLPARAEYKSRYSELKQQFDDFKKSFFESYMVALVDQKDLFDPLFDLELQLSTTLGILEYPVKQPGAGLLNRKEWDSLRSILDSYGIELDEITKKRGLFDASLLMATDITLSEQIQNKSKDRAIWWLKEMRNGLQPVTSRLQGNRLIKIVLLNKRNV